MKKSVSERLLLFKIVPVEMCSNLKVICERERAVNCASLSISDCKTFSAVGFHGTVDVGSSVLRLHFPGLLACPGVGFPSFCHMHCLRVRKQVGTSPVCRRAAVGKLLYMDALCHCWF